MNWLKKVWNDPVGSKVIAGIIFAGFAQIVQKISPEMWNKFYNFKIPVIWVIVVLFALWLIFGVYKRIIRKKKKPVQSIYTKEQLELKKYSQKQMGSILWKWEVLVGGFHFEQPKTSNLQPYCTLHDTPLKMRAVSNYECPFPNCLNHFPISEMYTENPMQVKYIIESELETKYEQLLSK